jgi:hypothetical protein
MRAVRVTVVVCTVSRRQETSESNISKYLVSRERLNV